MRWTNEISVGVALALLLMGPRSLGGQTPSATVTGPIPERAAPGHASNDFIFSTSGINLDGYVEEEFFLEGTANRYDRAGLETGAVLEADLPYKTRFVVRRPIEAERFNGTVVVEWYNVTGGRDTDIDWFQAGAYWVREGYAWVGVSAQRVGVDHLRDWSPARYGSLDVTAGGTVEGDALSYDMFSAVGEALREPGDVDPLGGLEVERLFATGHSQSASRLAIYLNNVHPRDPVFDAVMVHGGGGEIRTDQPVKVFKLMAETDLGRQVAIRQADTDRFRNWEVAGTSHVDLFFGQERAKVVAIYEGRDPETASLRELRCDRPVYSRVPFRHVMHAAFHHMVRWVQDGTQPPEAPLIEVADAGPPAMLARDEYGNALGGIRLAGVEVPTATNSGMNTGDGFCRLYGSHEPFAPTLVSALYPDSDTYVRAVAEVVQRNVAEGFLLPYDAQQTLAEARQSMTGGRVP